MPQVGAMIPSEEGLPFVDDFRLEVDGVLKSWAIPQGLSLDPSMMYGQRSGFSPAGILSTAGGANEAKPLSVVSLPLL